MAKSISKGKMWWIARPSSYDDAANIAISTCNNKFNVSDCIIAMVSDRNVFEDNKQNYQIQSAQSTCRKVGYKEGTEKFADCTIQMMSQAQGQSQERSQTVIVGPPRKHPKVACDAMGGLIC